MEYVTDLIVFVTDPWTVGVTAWTKAQAVSAVVQVGLTLYFLYGFLQLSPPSLEG